MRTFGNLLVFSPELWLLAGALVIFLLARFMPAVSTTVVAVVTVVLAFLALATQFKSTLTILDGAFLLDRFAIFIDVVVLGCVVAILLLSRADILPGDAEPLAAPAFMLLATLGAMLAASAADIVALFVALELLAVNGYVLAALARPGRGVAAGMGYLAAGLTSSAVLLYGLALIYGLTGETRLAAAGKALVAVGPGRPAVLLALTLVLGGFALRIGLAPTRWWTRGFEAGVPLWVVGFVESAGVVAGFAVLTRLLVPALPPAPAVYTAVIAAIAAIAMSAGNLLALTQTSVRRLLAYSSVAQAGYALAAFTDLQHTGVPSLLVFLTGWALVNLCAFGVVIAYARMVHTDAIRDLAAMARFEPALALAFGLALASLAGLPPMAGFFGKLFVLQSAVEGGYAWLAVIGVANIVLAAFGYLRVVKTMYLDPPVFEVVPVRLDRSVQIAVGATAVALTFFALALGPLFGAANYARFALLH